MFRMFCFYQEFYFWFYHTRIQQVLFPQSLPSDSRIVGAQKSIHCPPNCRHDASRLTTNKDSKLSLSCIYTKCSTHYTPVFSVRSCLN